ncbi:MAG: thioredoxin family protein [Fusobacteriaceae bacterium]|nr:thioredoxin family protein [Fusobacteriaceae bacterium]MBP6322905.1 thioredoxin family protein [Fusobacteriaceae bacterium]MBP9510569.1 thioredoxin family protein [Fusobacteriaceae bacterium]
MKKNTDYSIDSSSGVVLLIFWAEWCGPCKLLMPLVDEIRKEVNDIYTINVDYENLLVEKYKIKSVPTILFFKDGKLVETLIGYSNKNEILEKIMLVK